MWPLFRPFQGVVLCKNHKNSSKSTFLKLFDLIMTGNFVYFLISYEICIVDCFFNVFICHFGPCDLYLDPFRGLCYVKMTNIKISCIFWHLVFKTYPRDPGIAGLFSNEICIVNCLFNVFICHPGPCDHFLDPFRGSCCLKITQNSSKSTFLKLFNLIMTGNLVYFLFSYEIRIRRLFI